MSSDPSWDVFSTEIQRTQNGSSSALSVFSKTLR